MFIKVFATKFLVVIFGAFCILNCANSKNSTDENSLATSSNANVVQVKEKFSGTLAKVKGENSKLIIAESLEKSVQQIELPKIWLEFEQENGKVFKTELDEEFSESLKSAGETLLHYQYVINNSENPDARYDASYNQLITGVNSLNKIRELKVESPDGKRKLTEEEISEVFSKQSGMINDRYFEIDDHFKPKSLFYKFKKAVNEKLGYSIF